MQELFSVSPQLFRNVEKIGEKILSELEGMASVAEYVTLPEAGQHVVLRYEFLGKISSLDEIDAIENMLDRLVGENFWAVLVGETYRKVDPAFSLDVLQSRLKKFSRIVANEPLPVSSTPFALKIEEDAKIIRSHIPLSSDDWVWEVEVPLTKKENLPIIRIVSSEFLNEKVKIGNQEFIVESIPPDDTYEALIKAYPLARKSGKSLIRFIFDQTS